MKISELIQQLNSKLKDLGDVEVRSVSGIVEGFGVVSEVLDRRDYRDEGLFSGEVEKGRFVVLEIAKRTILFDENYRDCNDVEGEMR